MKKTIVLLLLFSLLLSSLWAHVPAGSLLVPIEEMRLWHETLQNSKQTLSLSEAALQSTQSEVLKQKENVTNLISDIESWEIRYQALLGDSELWAADYQELNQELLALQKEYNRLATEYQKLLPELERILKQLRIYKTTTWILAPIVAGLIVLLVLK